MRNKIGMFLAIGLMTTVIALYPLPCEGQSLPKLDCQKMVLDYVKAFENLDYRTIFRLKGQPYSKEVESEVKLSESSSL